VPIAGALNNTPALAAASARAADPSAPTIGYSITYLGGVILMLAVAAWSLRRPGGESRREEIGHETIRVEVHEPITVDALSAAHGQGHHRVAPQARPCRQPDDGARGGRDDRSQRPRHRRRTP
jgi:hypothetical protein